MISLLNKRPNVFRAKIAYFIIFIKKVSKMNDILVNFVLNNERRNDIVNI